MQEEREKLKDLTIGRVIKKGNNLVYEAGPTFNGMAYKNCNEFYYGNGICYISEHGFDDSKNWAIEIPEEDERVIGYTRQDFLNIVREEVGYEVPDNVVIAIATDVFETVDWQYPETYLYEMDLEEEFEYFKNVNEKGDLDGAIL